MAVTMWCSFRRKNISVCEAWIGERCKMPERLQVVASIPHNAIGKIDRQALLALAADASHGSVGKDDGRLNLSAALS
jgi:acyl-coenzyme A synthetase/AMP-(fatty) acid ligase